MLFRDSRSLCITKTGFQPLPHAFFHPDCTVGFGIAPNLRRSARGLYRQSGISPCPCTANREFHPALKTCLFKCYFYSMPFWLICQPFPVKPPKTLSPLLPQPDHLVDGPLGAQAQFLRQLDFLAALAFERPVDVHQRRQLHIRTQKPLGQGVKLPFRAFEL